MKQRSFDSFLLTAAQRMKGNEC